MTDLPREKLSELIATYGQTLCDDPRRCEALLRDLCAANRREVHVLVSALRERVAADLLAASEGVPREVLRARLTQRLQDNLGLTQDIAQWAVDSWALALGRLSQAELGAVAASSSTASGPASPLPSRRRPLMLAGLGVGVFLVVLGTALFYRGGQKGISTQPPAQSDRGTNLDKARPYPFGQADPVGYLKSLVIADSLDVWQDGPHVYCLGKQKRKMYCAYGLETVSSIILPLSMAGEKNKLAQSLVWLKLTEGRSGEEYLVGSSSTLNESVGRLADTWQKLNTRSSTRWTRLDGQLAFIFDHQGGSLLVLDREVVEPRLQKEGERHQSSSTPGNP